jgi:hypothetical protein
MEAGELAAALEWCIDGMRQKVDKKVLWSL